MDIKTLQSSAQWYVYELVDPRTNQVFYVGKGKGKRIDAHERDAAKGICSKKTNKINNIWRAGLQVQKRQVAYFWDEQAAYDHETDVIEFYGLENLTNVIPGVSGAWSSRLQTRQKTRKEQYAKPLVLHEWLEQLKSERLFQCFAEWFRHGFHKGDKKLKVIRAEKGFLFHAQITEVVYNKMLVLLWERIVASKEAQKVFSDRMKPYNVEFVHGCA